MEARRTVSVSYTHLDVYKRQAVHPDDERYKDIVGKKCILPLTDREIPIVADYYVDKEFGTGAVKITPVSYTHLLGVSIAELLTGELKINDNPSGNMKKIHFYVCPICGNIITSVGQGSFSCCGITLPEQEAEKGDEIHEVSYLLKRSIMSTMYPRRIL